MIKSPQPQYVILLLALGFNRVIPRPLALEETGQVDSLEDEDLKKIEARELEVHIKVLDFLERHKDRYFDEKEIAEKTDLPVKEVRQTIENTRVNIDYGEIDTIRKDEKEYFGIK